MIYRSLLKHCVALVPAMALIATAGDMSPRVIELDVAKAIDPIDRFFDLSIGSDYPGTLIRDGSQAQLKTVKVENGRTRYDFSGIDKLYDGLLAKGIRSFVPRCGLRSCQGFC